MRFSVLVAAVLFSIPAFASEGEKMAVPQFDPSSYSSQIFWLLVSFAALYVLMAKIALPRVGFVVEQRAARIAQDIDAAKAAATEAASTQLAYEAALNDARSQARDKLAAAAAQAQTAQTATLAQQNSSLVDRLKSAEQTIAKAQQAAAAAIAPAAATTAATVLQKLTSMPANADALLPHVNTYLTTKA